MGKFTAEEIQIAKAVDLVDLAEQIGIPLKRKGRFYQAVGMDSVMIFNRSSWCRFSQGVGGSTIDFLEYFRNMDFVEAVKYLLEFAGYIRTETMQKFQPERQAEKIEETKQRKDIPKEPFVLPSKSETSRRLYGYLIKQRKLSKQMIDFWVKRGFCMRAERTITWFLWEKIRKVSHVLPARGEPWINMENPLKEMLRGMTKLMGLIW